MARAQMQQEKLHRRGRLREGAGIVKSHEHLR